MNEEIKEMTAPVITAIIMEGLKDGELKLTDDIFRQFVPCVMAEGNVSFLKTIAEVRYDDARKDVVLEFLNYINNLVVNGRKELMEGVHGSDC